MRDLTGNVASACSRFWACSVNALDRTDDAFWEPVKDEICTVAFAKLPMSSTGHFMQRQPPKRMTHSIVSAADEYDMSIKGMRHYLRRANIIGAETDAFMPDKVTFSADALPTAGDSSRRTATSGEGRQRQESDDYHRGSGVSRHRHEVHGRLRFPPGGAPERPVAFSSTGRRYRRRGMRCSPAPYRSMPLAPMNTASKRPPGAAM